MTYGYTENASAVSDPRKTEFAALARITGELEKANKNKEKNHGYFLNALHKNRMLWTYFARAVADEHNALEKEIRAQLFFLSEYTMHLTAKVISENADPQPLIEINKSLMQGLNGKSPQG
ncbi:MAG: flagellar biosynthesis regulator FlaF [Pseudomonadota bacterium]